MKPIKILSIIALSGLSAAAWAQQQPADVQEPAAVPEPPEIPLPIHSGEEMPPDITIIRKNDETIHEYRRNGKLYMIKVQPQIGPAYYMYDTNGDEQMDKNDMDRTGNINMWNLFQWDW
jgi:Protein of unknown function (DUF2782)